MASLSVYPINSTSVMWSVSGLSNPWNSSYYSQISLTNDSSMKNDTTSSPTGVIGSMSPPSSGTDTSTDTSYASSGAFSGGNTYYLYAYALASNGKWYYIGSSSVTMPMDRPNDFSWTTAKSIGVNFNITADEWNGLCSRVNEFRTYKKLGSYSFTTAQTGNDFTAGMYNEVRNAIYPMNPLTPPFRSKGDTIYANDINGLKDSLNAVS